MLLVLSLLYRMERAFSSVVYPSPQVVVITSLFAFLLKS